METNKDHSYQPDTSFSPPQGPERILLGGFFESYEESYANAWRELMPKSREMALPILYLQRHTFELIVKSLLKNAILERRTLHNLDELFGTVSGPGPAASTDFELVHTTHAFKQLFPCLRTNMEALGRPNLPKEFHELRDLFEGVDEDKPDRLRFETQFSRKKGTTAKSFPHVWEHSKTKSAPCQEVANLLNSILEAKQQAIDSVVNDDLPPDNTLGDFYFGVYEAYKEIEGEVKSRLSPITIASREGKLHWSEVQPHDICVEADHTLESLTKDICGGLAATFNERPLILVCLKDIIHIYGSKGKRCEDGFFLAAHRPNGTLTAGIWPDDYQSNLAYEAFQSFKRDNGCGK